MNKLSILMPTYNRPDKLFRQLFYISRLCNGLPCSPFDSLEIVVADGSVSHPSGTLGQSFTDLLECCISRCGLKYFYLPNTTLLSRIVWLFENSYSEYIMLLGEEDLLLPDHLAYGIEFLDANENVSTWAGRLINVISYPLSFAKASLSIDERPFAGFVLDHSLVVSRLTAYFTLNSVGTSALAYSIQRRSLFQVYLGYLSAHSESLYYGGIELLHQVISLGEGGVCVSNRPLILRDFMYENYLREPKREAPSSDPYPYYGESAVNLCSTYLDSKTLIGISESLQFFVSIFRLNTDLSLSRSILSSSLNSRELCEKMVAYQLSGSSLNAFRDSYLMYFARFKSIRQKVHIFLRSFFVSPMMSSLRALRFLFN